MSTATTLSDTSSSTPNTDQGSSAPLLNTMLLVPLKTKEVEPLFIRDIRVRLCYASKYHPLTRHSDVYCTHTQRCCSANVMQALKLQASSYNSLKRLHVSCVKHTTPTTHLQSRPPCCTAIQSQEGSTPQADLQCCLMPSQSNGP